MFKGGAILQPLAPFTFSSKFSMFSKISDEYENMESAKLSTDDSLSGCSRISGKSFNQVWRTAKNDKRQLEHRLP